MLRRMPFELGEALRIPSDGTWNCFAIRGGWGCESGRYSGLVAYLVIDEERIHNVRLEGGGMSGDLKRICALFYSLVARLRVGDEGIWERRSGVCESSERQPEFSCMIWHGPDRFVALSVRPTPENISTAHLAVTIGPQNYDACPVQSDPSVENDEPR